MRREETANGCSIVLERLMPRMVDVTGHCRRRRKIAGQIDPANGTYFDRTGVCTHSPTWPTVQSSRRASPCWCRREV